MALLDYEEKTIQKANPRTSLPYYKLDADVVMMFPTKSVIACYLYLGLKSMQEYNGGFKGDISKLKKCYHLDDISDEAIDKVLDDLIEQNLLKITKINDTDFLFEVMS